VRSVREGDMARIYVSSTYGDLTAPLCVIYEGWVSVKTWSAPGWLAGVGGRGPGGGRVDQSSIRAGSPMVSCGWGGSIKLAAVAQQGHDTHRARPDQAAGYDVEGAG
jgi:hypothetical protein